MIPGQRSCPGCGLCILYCCITIFHKCSGEHTHPFLTSQLCQVRSAGGFTRLPCAVTGHAKLPAASHPEAAKTFPARSGCWLSLAPCSRRPEASVSLLAVHRASLPASRNLSPVLAPGFPPSSKPARVCQTCLMLLVPDSSFHYQPGRPLALRAPVIRLGPPGHSPVRHVT